MKPSLSGFIGDFAALSQGFLLPPVRRRRWRHWLGLLPSSAGVAVGAAGLLVGSFSLLLHALLGSQRLSLAFPYLQPALDLFLQERHWLVALLLTGISLAALLLQLGAMAAPLRRRWQALVTLLSLLVLTTAVDVAFTEGNGAVMDALNRRSAGAFWGTAAGLMAIYLLTLPIQFLNTYGQQRFALAWRDASTSSMQRGYLSELTYYHLEAEAPLSAQVDNPDQRIAEDIQRSVTSSTDLAFGFSASLLALAAYIVVLIGISNILVLTLLVATLIGNGVIVRLVRRLAGLNFRQQTLEAEFRFALVHIRNNAEKIAFLRGEQPIALELRRRFTRLLVNFERLIRWRALVDQSSGLYAFLMQFVPYLVLSVAYFAGRVSLGQLTVASIAFAQVQSSLSFLIDRADSFAGLFASLERIGSLSRVVGNGLETLVDPAAHAHAQGSAVPQSRAAFTQPSSLALAPSQDFRREGSPITDPSITRATPLDLAPDEDARRAGPMSAGTATPLLRLRGLTVTRAAGGEALIRQLDLVIEAGERLLITGPSGCGKTSLLRVLSELVPAAAGSIERSAGLTMLVLPQAPYMTLGSLRQQLLFPALEACLLSADQLNPDAVNPERLKTDPINEGPINPAPLHPAPLYPGQVSNAPSTAAPSRAAPSTAAQLPAARRAASPVGALQTSRSDPQSLALAPEAGDPRARLDAQLRSILRQVRLQALEQRHPDLGEICDWSRVLSGGEQQRVGFARLLLHQPDLAVLDEATSALDLDSEAHLYGDLVARGCTLISVGHRRSLRAFHQRELRLDGQGGWTLRPIA